MVRFIICAEAGAKGNLHAFTFQYGQIYYFEYQHALMTIKEIYIPIWLDLLFAYNSVSIQRQSDLHSNMVRFIINDTNEMNEEDKAFTFQYGQIYYYRFEK